MHKTPDTKYLYNYNKTLTCIYLYEADLFTLYNFELTSASLAKVSVTNVGP